MHTSSDWLNRHKKTGFRSIIKQRVEFNAGLLQPAYTNYRSFQRLRCCRAVCVSLCSSVNFQTTQTNFLVNHLKLDRRLLPPPRQRVKRHLLRLKICFQPVSGRAVSQEQPARSAGETSSDLTRASKLKHSCVVTTSTPDIPSAPEPGPRCVCPTPGHDSGELMCNRNHWQPRKQRGV